MVLVRGGETCANAGFVLDSIITRAENDAVAIITRAENDAVAIINSAASGNTQIRSPLSSFTNWAGGHPTSEQCVHMGSDGGWRSVSCSTSFSNQLCRVPAVGEVSSTSSIVGNALIDRQSVDSASTFNWTFVLTRP